MSLSFPLGAWATWFPGDWIVYRAEAAEGAAPAVPPRRFFYDPADKLLLRHSLVMAAFLLRALPDLYREVGCPAPFAPADITVDTLEWGAGGTPDAPDLTRRTSDVVAFLHHAGQLCAIVPVEVQARYQAEMTIRMHQYAGHAMEWCYRHRLHGPDAAPLPVVPLLIAMGDQPWPADRGPWLMGPTGSTPGYTGRLMPYARQDLADWQATPRDHPPLDDWAAVFFALALLRADSRYELTRRPPLADRAAAAAVEGLADRTQALTQRIVAKAQAEDPSGRFEESWLYYLVRWVNGTLLPLWSGILQKEIEALDTLEGLTVFNDVVQEVKTAYQAQLAYTLTEGEQKGRQALAVEQLVGTVQRHGALPPAELDAYRDRLADLPVASLPDAVQVGERLVAFPAGPSRQRAVRTFVDTGRVPTPQDPD